MSADCERLPPPNNPSDFESLCLDLWKDIWRYPGAEKNGRNGQPQAGVDVYGLQDEQWVGVQCKQKDGLLRRTLTVDELDSEIRKALTFKPRLTLFILATTGPADVNVQQRARELTDEHRHKGLFVVEVWSWERIWHEIYGREELLRRIGGVYWPRLWGFIEGDLKSSDRSAVLFELPHAETIVKLFQVIQPQPYVFTTTSTNRELLKLAKRSSGILNLASKVIIETWESHPNVAGILATLLSNNIELWQPQRVVMSKLQELCTTAIDSGDCIKVAAVEPLAFAISGRSYPEVHRALLERLISEARWREEDAHRVRRYYGNVGHEIAAIYRHWNYELRGGLLKANDVSRLIDMLLSNDETLRKGGNRQVLLKLLVDQAGVLRDAGEARLAGTVVEFVEGFGSLRSK